MADTSTAEEIERERFFEALTPADEEKLKVAHMKDYHGTDDDAPDAYEAWLESEAVGDLKRIIQSSTTA